MPERIQRLILARSDGKTRKAVVGQIVQYFIRDKKEFCSMDIENDTGISKKLIANHLKLLEVNHVLMSLGTVHNVKYFSLTQDAFSFVSSHLDELISEFQFDSEYADSQSAVINKMQTEKRAVYTDSFLSTINLLMTSASSQKDRRIGEMISKCMDRGRITKADYRAVGEESKWSVDMNFARQLGLVEKISYDEYRINTDIDTSYDKLRDSQKSTLSALYDLFGEDAFSADMVIANLDYSSAHVSGILHQFTWLRLLDCTVDENNTYSYQLNVNPTDNPECFETAA